MFALNTDTISHYMRGGPQIMCHLHALSTSQILVPAVVVYEVHYGLAHLPSQAAKPRLLAVRRFLAPV